MLRMCVPWRCLHANSSANTSICLLSLKPVAFATFHTRAEAEKAKEELQVRHGEEPNSVSCRTMCRRDGCGVWHSCLHCLLSCFWLHIFFFFTSLPPPPSSHLTTVLILSHSFLPLFHCFPTSSAPPSPHPAPPPPLPHHRASSLTPITINCSGWSLPEPTVEWRSRSLRSCSQMEDRMAYVSWSVATYLNSGLFG